MSSDTKMAELKGPGKMQRAVILLLPLAVCFWLGSRVLGTANGQDRSVPGETRARKFVVVDDAGQERAQFGLVDDGEVGLVVWNEKKSAAVSVSIDRFGMPRVALENSKAQHLLSLGILQDLYPVVLIADANGQRRLGLTVLEDGSVAFAMYDAEKRNRCAISLSKEGNPRIVMRDAKGQDRARLMLDDKGTCALDLLDGKGREHIVLQVDAEGQGDAAVFGPDGKRKWSAEKP